MTTFVLRFNGETQCRQVEGKGKRVMDQPVTHAPDKLTALVEMSRAFARQDYEAVREWKQLWSEFAALDARRAVHDIRIEMARFGLSAKARNELTKLRDEVELVLKEQRRVK